jgi:hypothetical protein
MLESQRQRSLKKKRAVQKISQGPENLSFPSADDLEQSKAFIENAREIEADEKRSAADRLMGQLPQIRFTLRDG